MTLKLTRQQVRQVDQRAIEQLAIPSMVLMENAARNAAQAIHERIAGQSPIAIVCGGGNNAGDGYALARHMLRLGHSPVIHAVKPPAELTGDAADNYDISRRLGVDIRDAAGPYEGAVVVDAILGTGFAGGTLRPEAAAAIEKINLAGQQATVVALDLPSGLDGDTGTPANPTVRANFTITFVAQKVGFDHRDAQAYLGEVLVRDIGLPENWVRDLGLV